MQRSAICCILTPQQPDQCFSCAKNEQPYSTLCSPSKPQLTWVCSFYRASQAQIQQRMRRANCTNTAFVKNSVTCCLIRPKIHHLYFPIYYSVWLELCCVGAHGQLQRALALPGDTQVTQKPVAATKSPTPTGKSTGARYMGGCRVYAQGGSGTGRVIRSSCQGEL